MTHDELVERVARAMCKSDGTAQCAAICLSRFSINNTDGLCSDAVLVHGRKARAALAAVYEAMKEPTWRMLELGSDARYLSHEGADAVWKAMLSASPLNPEAGE